MPIVSINLSDEAYMIHSKWKQTSKASKNTSISILRWNAGMINSCRIGDRRTSIDGVPLIFDGFDFVVMQE
jgi:hypothetical protein